MRSIKDGMGQDVESRAEGYACFLVAPVEVVAIALAAGLQVTARPRRFLNHPLPVEYWSV